MQNIAEGSQASGTSRKTELKLTSVARASLEELKLDYEDFLRQRGLGLWERDDPRRKELVGRRPKTADDVARWVKEKSGNGQDGQDGQDGQHGHDGQSTPGEGSSIESIPSIKSISSIQSTIAANAALVLIGVACALLDRQLTAQSTSFENEGGFTEKLFKRRQAIRR